MTTTIRGTDNTAAAPALTGTDTDTGIFFPAADTIAFAEGGAEVARFNSAGNFGIGTSSPQSKLDLLGPASVTSFTGTTKLGLAVRGSTGVTDYSGIDFYGAGEGQPTARIAVLSGGGGSTLVFGVSNNYASGITLAASSVNQIGQQFSVVPGGSATLYPEYKCRAWVNFDGTASGTFAGGVSTVTRIAGSTTATVTTTNDHGLITGNNVNALTGVAAGLYAVTVTGDKTFTITTIATTALTAASITFSVNSIRASGNASSITDIGTGDYMINFSTAMPDANYAFVGTCQGAGAGNAFIGVEQNQVSAPTASALRILVKQSATANDRAIVCVSIFR
jgi:hypothetical protein